jgi:hypothetical protein
LKSFPANFIAMVEKLRDSLSSLFNADFREGEIIHILASAGLVFLGLPGGRC